MSEFRFKIDAYTPETIPMEVLAQYLANLAEMLGTPEAVHLVRLEAGSVIPVIKIEEEAKPAVRARVKAVKSGTAPVAALRAYQAINERLKKDKSSGRLIDVEQTDAEIIQFPGAAESEESYGSVRKQGTLDGEVIMVGGKNRARVPVHLQIDDRVISYVHAKKGLAQELGSRLYTPVRLYGSGRWRRNPIGVWGLEDFSVDRFEPLKADSLSKALVALRAIGGAEWDENSLSELRDLRIDEQDT